VERGVMYPEKIKARKERERLRERWRITAMRNEALGEETEDQSCLTPALQREGMDDPENTDRYFAPGRKVNKEMQR
jgi:hypothetical protein